MNNALCIRAEGLSFSYGQRSILQHASIEVGRGECVGITGENGSGKSTLLKLLVGYLKPSSGSIERMAPMGYVPQDVILAESLTMKENIAFFARAYGSAWKTERVDAEFHALKIAQHADTVVSQLSGGTKQKLNFLVALLHEPVLLLLDEPFNALDWESYLAVRTMLETWRKQGRSILVISHLVFDPAWFDRVLILRNGALLCDGN